MVNSSAIVDLHTCDSHSDTIEEAWESAVLLMLCIVLLKKIVYLIDHILDAEGHKKGFQLLLSYYFVQEIRTLI